MYRRRRSHREKIFFSFDSFLDVVANVIGIIIRLILVAWVGARTYTATMEFTGRKSGAGTTCRPGGAHAPTQGCRRSPGQQIGPGQGSSGGGTADLVEKLRNLESAKVKTELTRAELEALAQKNQQIADEQQGACHEAGSRGQKSPAGGPVSRWPSQAWT